MSGEPETSVRFVCTMRGARAIANYFWWNKHWKTTTSVEHALCLVSINPNCRGSWHHPLKHSVPATLSDAHLDSVVSCVWFWQCRDMMELCKVWVSMRKCMAALPITHSSAGHGQPSCSWVTEQQSCTSIQDWLQIRWKRDCTTLFIQSLICLMVSFAGVLVFLHAAMIREKGKTTSTMKVHLSAHTLRA